MKVLTGAYQRDAGEVLVAGVRTSFASPRDSRERGIEMIYQDFALCGNMDVGQNIFRVAGRSALASSSIGRACMRTRPACSTG